MVIINNEYEVNNQENFIMASFTAINVCDSSKWNTIVKSFTNHDIYYLNEYVRTFQAIGDGEPILLYFEDKETRLINVTMKRDIAKNKIFSGRIQANYLFDLATPYGYGGFLCDGKSDDLSFKHYGKWCRENNIVSEFIRFNPIFDNVHFAKDYFEVSYLRNTVGTKLYEGVDFMYTEFTKSCRKSINKALQDGVSFKITLNPESINKFYDIYCSSMDRNSAEDYYYFGSEYFNKCLELLKDNIVLVEAIMDNTIIAMGFYFVYKKVIHIHLSGTLSKYINFSPAYILKYAIATWGKENGYELLHHGGGRSNASDDSLYMFKKKFGKNTEFQFYTGKKIWNTNIYSELCEVANVNHDIDYFPAYRYENLYK